MSENIVINPETGLPAREVTTYIELDRAQLEQDLEENKAELKELLASKRKAFEATLDQDEDVKAARGAVEESKSELAVYDELTPRTTDSAGEAGASVEDSSAAEAGDSDDSVSESDGDSSEGDAAPKKVAIKELDSTEEADDAEDTDEEEDSELY